MDDKCESDTSKDILYINFNQTATALTIGSKTGYTLYDLNTIDECYPTSDSPGCLRDVCIVERSFSTSLIAYVRLEKPRNLVLLYHIKGTVIVEKSFPNTILSVKLNRQNIVVSLEDSIFIMDINNVKDQNTHVITDTPENPKGLIALTYGPAEKDSLLAYPGSSTNGNVQIFDCKQKRANVTILAHNGPLAALAFDENGEKLATASIKGTVIRVFSLNNGQKLFEFRRGVRRNAEISCLSFCKNPELLCVASNTETVHIFKLAVPEIPQPAEEEAEGWIDMFGRVFTQSAKYLPTQVSEALTQQRDFAYLHLPFESNTTICAISYIRGTPYVVVASLQGFLYIYDINMELGGPCRLLKQHRLEGPRIVNVPLPIGNLRFKNDSSVTKDKLQSNTGCDDPIDCLNPEIVKDLSADVPQSSDSVSNVPELCASNGVVDVDSRVDDANVNNGIKDSCNEEPSVSNGISDSCDGLPPILNQVEP